MHGRGGLGGIVVLLSRSRSYSSIGFQGEPSRLSTQQEIYDELGCWLLDSTFQGYNTSIFAYGQTGSGKSFTMFGGDGALVDRCPSLPLCACFVGCWWAGGVLAGFGFIASHLCVRPSSARPSEH
jgi:hypothetical protein